MKSTLARASRFALRSIVLSAKCNIGNFRNFSSLQSYWTFWIIIFAIYTSLTRSRFKMIQVLVRKNLSPVRVRSRKTDLVTEPFVFTYLCVRIEPRLLGKSCIMPKWPPVRMRMAYRIRCHASRKLVLQHCAFSYGMVEKRFRGRLVDGKLDNLFS